MIEQISPYSEGLLSAWFSDVAQHLTGRPTRIVWADEIRRDYGIRGTVRRTAKGGAVIYLRRGAGWQSTYLSCLHEIAHIKHDYKSIWLEGSARERFPDFIGAAGKANARPLENRAATQSEIWRQWARSKAGTTAIIPQLEALMKWEG